MTPSVLASLEHALLLRTDDLVMSFAAGSAELAELSPDITAAEPWSEGSLAWRYPAPDPLAGALAREVLFERVGTVSLAIDPSSTNAVSSSLASYPFLGIESDLPPTWKPASAVLRYRNTLGVFRGSPGIHREASRRMVFEREGASITVTEEPRSQANEATLAASLSAFWTDDAQRSGTALLQGHPALWVFLQPSLDRQSIVVTWHCPVQGRLYAAVHELTDGKPGMPDEPLELMARHVRCSHGSS
jgi:hypothetical protein